MYESPIQITQHKIQADLSEKVDESIYTAVVRSDIHVDRDELIRALRYDRCQYEKGFADGKADAMQWISVKDRLPGIHEYVLMHSYSCGSDIGFRMDDELFGCDVGYYLEIGDVTHWMPLPEPPKEEEADDK